MKAVRTRVLSWLVSLCVAAVALPAAGLPGFYIGKGTQKRHAYSTHIVVLQKGELSSVSVMTDYDGPLDAFALVLAVPPDVTLEKVKTLKREYVDRVDQMSAPRYHEFWEMDPCDGGPNEQEWERKLTASEPGFLGGVDPMSGEAPKKKVDKELFLRTDSEFKEGEYVFTLLEGQSLKDFAGSKGFTLPAGAEQAAAGAIAQGFKLLVAEVDAKRIELVGGGRGQLSPIRWWSDKPTTKLPVRLGLISSPGKQELVIYVFDPQARYQVKNYGNAFPPTNVEAKLELEKDGRTTYVKERTGEMYAAIHDRILAKQPNTFLNEYAWHSLGCGEPCPTAPLWIHELLTLGADNFETIVSDEEKNPEVEELTKEEKKALKEEWDFAKLTPKERKDREKQIMDDRKKTAANKALVERHKYMVSRLHHRYNAAGLPRDVELAPAPNQVKGGIDIPKGPKGDLPRNVVGAPVSKLQTRFVHFHPWKGMQKCAKPERWRWGKAPRTYRGLRKIWIAEDLSRRDRKQIKLEQVILTAIPELGLTGIPEDPSDGGADGGLGAEGGKGSCGCEVVRAESPGFFSTLAAAGLLAAFGYRRRRRKG